MGQIDQISLYKRLKNQKKSTFFYDSLPYGKRLNPIWPGGGGGTLCPPDRYLRISEFYPVELSRFLEKKTSLSDLPKFHKGGPLQIGSNASLAKKSFKSQKLLWRVLGIQTS